MPPWLCGRPFTRHGGDCQWAVTVPPGAWTIGTSTSSWSLVLAMGGCPGLAAASGWGSLAAAATAAAGSHEPAAEPGQPLSGSHSEPGRANAGWPSRPDSGSDSEITGVTVTVTVGPPRGRLSSGPCRKFRPVICQVYSRHMTSHFIYLSYICHMILIYFPTKLKFLSYQVGIWHPSKLPIHTMRLEWVFTYVVIIFSRAVPC
jgi:hypothetical protein